jgi:L-malate glycosyltransferase
MRVLYFSDNTSDHNRRFLEKLAQAELDVWFLDPTNDCLPENWLPEGVRWIRPAHVLDRQAEPPAFAQMLDRFNQLLREINPDLVHAGPTHDCGYVTALSGFHPWLLMSWGSDVLYQPNQGLPWLQATQTALKSADGFFCDCDAVRVRARQIANLSDDGIVQFPWGIRKGSYSPFGPLPAEAEFVREADTRIVLSTRSWEPIYGIPILLEGFRQAYLADPRLRLLLLGNGSQAPLVRRYIETRGLEGVIRIPGNIRRSDMPKWFRAADIYINCSRSDGTSISLLEAMATGLPVVVTDLPANREWVTADENGWLSAADSSEDFADKLLRAARLNPEQRRQFAENSRSTVERRADWDQNFPKLLRMYDHLTSVKV